MSAPLYIVMEFNQASGQPSPFRDLYADFSTAEAAAQSWRETAARYGRRETYGIAEVRILDEDGPA